jgi:hypothetical protein
MKRLWIRKSLLSDWEFSGGESTSISCTDLNRTHEIWKYASEKIQRHNNRDSLSTGIASLKRCIEHRINQILKAYPFEKIKSTPKISKRKKLELIESYDLVRPDLIVDLINKRNMIEHEDSLPPTQNDCRQFADIIWYFLKATEHLVTSIPNIIVISDENQFIEINFNRDSKRSIQVFPLKGNIAIEHISFKKKDDYFCVEDFSIVSTKQELDEEELLENNHLIFNEKIIFVEGKIIEGGIQHEILKRTLKDPWR